MKTYKTCGCCLQEVATEDFYRNKAAKDGLTNKCKGCSKDYSSKYKSQNRELVEAYRNNYIGLYLEKTKDKRLAWQRNYRETHIEERKSYDREYHKTRYKDQKEVYAEKSARRRCNKISATPSWLDDEHKKRLRSIYKACKNVTERSGKIHHVDHIVPLQGENVCGLHVWWNLRIIPAEMNLSKGNKFENAE